jgi:N-acetylmuramoyl-L-alanine amidase
VDPGHGDTEATDHYRIGPSGEREEWINMRVGIALKQLLEKAGANVLMTREEDVPVPLSERSKLAVDQHVDAFVSIHHNATADSSVNFPIIYFRGYVSENQASVLLARILMKTLSKDLYTNHNPGTIASDYIIFPKKGLDVLRGTYGIPAVLAEASFFTNPPEEQRLKYPDYNRCEAKAYFEALKLFFSNTKPSIYEMNSCVEVLKPFKVLEEEARMNPKSLKWKTNFINGLEMYYKKDSVSLKRALSLFTTSARSFPDSWLARQAHCYRAKIFEELKRVDKQHDEEIRIAEFFVPLLRNKSHLKKISEAVPTTPS